LTRVLYAFANASAGGECVSSDPARDDANWQALQTLKQAHPQLKVLISVGGWSQSGLFSDVAASAEARTHFAESCASFVTAHGFDGLDIDWEFPVEGGLPTNHTRPDDGLNFTGLLAELRRALVAQGATDGRRYLLTIAAPAGPAEYKHLDASW
jgi:chitinase